jgi:nicotinamidase-related amidase
MTVTAEETRELYAEAGIGGRLRLGERPVTLVVDLSRGFTDPHCPIGSDLSAVVEATRTLLEATRRRGLPAIFTSIAFDQHDHQRLTWLQKMPGLAVLLAGDALVEIDPRLERLPDEPVLFKKGASAIAGTDLASLLVGLGADTVVLCGATTSGCVRATAVDLVQMSYPVLIPAECVGDRAPGPHEASLLDLDSKYADVTDLSTTLTYLARVSVD